MIFLLPCLSRSSGLAWVNYFMWLSNKKNLTFETVVVIASYFALFELECKLNKTSA